VGRARSTGDRVTGIKDSFGLSELLPEAEAVEEASHGRSGPDSNLMRTVSVALKEDLARVKDTLDIYVRMGRDDVEEMAPLAELLRKVADTLGMLGLGRLQERVQAEQDVLRQIAEGAMPADESNLMQVASSLIEVEDRLGRRAVGGSDEAVAAEERQEVSGAVIRECIVNLARVKQRVNDFVKNPQARESLEPIPDLIRQIHAGLQLVELQRAGEVLKAAGHYIRSRLHDTASPPDQQSLDRLADALAP
jgi:chemosensory pili system protein ChpA (sensor histidine kinase/response regulator)